MALLIAARSAIPQFRAQLAVRTNANMTPRRYVCAAIKSWMQARSATPRLMLHVLPGMTAKLANVCKSRQ